MRALVQRVRRARVSVAGECVGEIGPGMLVFIAVTHSDGAKEAEYLAKKCVELRIFSDEQGKMNRSLAETGGEMLAVSQFTLYGDATQGRRPFFGAAAAPEPAKKWYEHFIAEVRAAGTHTECGIFGADMLVALENDGPVTILLESK